MNTIRKKDLGFSTAKSGAVPCRVLKDSMLMEYTTKTSPQQQERQKQHKHREQHEQHEMQHQQE